MSYGSGGLYPSGGYHTLQQGGGYQSRYHNSTESFLTVPEEKYQESKFDAPKGFTAKKKIILIAGAVLLVAAIAGGVIGGIMANKSKNKDRSSTSSPSGSDASFTKDARLHRSFAGMCYSPPNAANYPTCGDTIEGVVKDIQLISQLTTTLRTYGADCNASSLVLDAIDRTGVDLQVFLGLYFATDTSVFDRQLQETISVIQQYGTDHVAGIIVGNEYILDAYNAAGSASAANRAQTAAEKVVVANIATVRQAVEALNLSKNISIGTADAGSMITKSLAQGADFVMANVHPFFSGVDIDEAAWWTYNFLETDTPSVVNTVRHRPPLYAAEVGWPSDAVANGSLTLNGSIASTQNLQSFLDNFVCASNTNQTKYFWFEAFDEAWKMPLYGGAEPYWGLFDSDRNLKDLTLPTCSVDFSMAA